MRNAAQLAIDEFAGPYVTLMIQDDRSTPDGAAQTAQAELGAGAELLLGPVYATDVRQAASVAKAAGKPIIGFSTDVSVASPGVYLLSFLIQGYVDRIVEFAASRGRKAFAVMAPQSTTETSPSPSSSRRPGAFNCAGRVTARYAPGDPQRRRSRWRRSAGQIDALFIPEQADGMSAVATALAATESRPSSSARASGTTRACCGCPACREPGSRRPTTRASTRWRSATRPSSTASRRGWRRCPTMR